jgi:protoheme IX farnesyltransferase
MPQVTREIGTVVGQRSRAGGRRAFMSTLAELAKVRLTGLVVTTTAVGYVLASPGHIGWRGLSLTLLGTWLAAAGAMALNQVSEVDRDALMERTRNRPLPSGQMTPGQALAIGLGGVGAGVLLLAVAVNVLTGMLAAVVVALYTLVYTPMKLRTPACTLVGAVCGAIPPVMGWTGASGSVGFGALFLATILFMWQIPHFLALAWLYRDDYERAGFRMLPVLDRDGRRTAFMAALYTAALLPVAITGWLSGLAGAAYAVGALVLGAAFLRPSLRLRRQRSADNARRLFLTSLAYLPLLLALLLADRRSDSAPAGLARSGAPQAAATLATSGTVMSNVHTRSHS